MRESRWAALLVAAGFMLGASCDSPKPVKTPLDIKDRFPAPDALQISIPGQRGAAGSGSEAAFTAVDQAAAALRATSVLKEFLDKGGEETRDVTITIALDGAPRVADKVVRYERAPTRLDVERNGDHAFFYMQYDWGYGYDPENAIGEGKMVIEGSTVPASKPGARSRASSATGISNPALGYMRFHFNHRPEDTDPVRSAAQLDYNMGTGSLHLTYFHVRDAKGVLPVAFWQIRKGAGGLVYASERDPTKGLQYQVIAQYRDDGSLAVWKGDGKLWGCYDPSGAELGNATNPGACGSFREKFVPPPGGSELWPGLPAGLP